MFIPYLEKQKLFTKCLKFILELQGFLKHIYIYKVCETFCPALRISMWELISFHVVFMVCVIVIASARGVSSPQGLKNSDTYPFEALPHYHSSSICQNYFAISTTRLSLNA